MILRQSCIAALLIICLAVPLRAQTLGRIQVALMRATLEALANYRSERVTVKLTLRSNPTRVMISVRMPLTFTEAADSLWFGLTKAAEQIVVRRAKQRIKPDTLLRLPKFPIQGVKLKVGPHKKGQRIVLDISYRLKLGCDARKYSRRIPFICDDTIALLGLQPLIPMMWNVIHPIDTDVNVPGGGWSVVAPGRLVSKSGRRFQFRSDGITFFNLMLLRKQSERTVSAGKSRLPVRIVGPRAMEPQLKVIATMVPRLFGVIEGLLGPFPRSHMTIAIQPRHMTSYSFNFGSFVALNIRTARRLNGTGSGRVSALRVLTHELLHVYFGTRVIGDPLGNGGMMIQEGITEYLAGRVLAALKIADFEKLRFQWMTRCYYQFRRGFWSLALSDITAFSRELGLVYCKGPLVLSTLADLVGAKTMTQRLRTFYQRFKNRFSGTDQLLSLLPASVRKFGRSLIERNVAIDFSLESATRKGRTLTLVVAHNRQSWPGRVRLLLSYRRSAGQLHHEITLIELKQKRQTITRTVGPGLLRVGLLSDFDYNFANNYKEVK